MRKPKPPQLYDGVFPLEPIRVQTRPQWRKTSGGIHLKRTVASESTFASISEAMLGSDEMSSISMRYLSIKSPETNKPTKTYWLVLDLQDELMADKDEVSEKGTLLKHWSDSSILSLIERDSEEFTSKCAKGWHTIAEQLAISLWPNDYNKTIIFRQTLYCRYRTVVPKPEDPTFTLFYVGMYNLNNCKNRVLCREAVPEGDWYWLKSGDKTKSSRN